MKKLFWLLVVVLLAWWAWSYYSQTPASIDDVDAALNALDGVDFEKELQAVDSELGNL